MATPTTAPTHGTAPIRRWIVRLTIGAFSLAALLGIIALLGAGDFGETEGKILLTTLLVGVVSIAVLCYLTSAGRPAQPIGVVGGVVVLVPLVFGLLLVWGNPDDGVDTFWLKTFGIGGIVAATIAQVCLLLLRVDTAYPLARRLLLATIGVAALLALMTSLMVLDVQPGDDTYVRALGIVAILDVLGTVVGAALARFGPGATTDATPRSPTLLLPPDVAAALAERAAATGRSRDELAAEILRSHLTAAQPQDSKP